MNRTELQQLIREELEAALQEKYTSSGTVPRVHKRKMTPAQIQKREQIGKKILSTLKRGGKNGRLRKKFEMWAKENDHPIDSEDTLNSYAWAMASDFAIGNKPFPPPLKNKGKKGKKRSKVGNRDWDAMYNDTDAG